MEAKELIKKFTANPGSDANKLIMEVSDAIKKEHRTYQASIIRNLIGILVECSDGRTDLRNESAIEACKVIKEHDFGIAFI